jgi:catechol 2,3-dioxygenase-like lactoylglutathione lyase family enzyme
VNDITISLRFFTEVLGFRQEFRLDNYAGVERDQCLIHLSLASNPNTGQPGAGSVYIFCDEVDAFYREIVSRGALPNSEPKDYSYGMRDFVVQDPDGNKISFGAPTRAL